MELTSPKIIKEILLKYETRASKGLGQNFLIDKNVLKKFIDSADIKPNDIILEVGPGIGTLTQELARWAGKVIAIEKDKKMCEILGETLKDFKNIKVINDDILKIVNWNFIENCKEPYGESACGRQMKIENYKVVANIPYYITSPMIRKFLEAEKKPDFMVLMLQKEVAQRICSKPPDMSLLSVSVQFYAEPKIISYVSKNCFWPSPKVDSAIIKITPHRDPFSDSAIRERVSDNFFKIVKAGFSQPRKQLVNNLAGLKFLNGVKLDKYKTAGWLLRNSIAPNQRAETLNVADWLRLVEGLCFVDKKW